MVLSEKKHLLKFQSSMKQSNTYFLVLIALLIVFTSSSQKQDTINNNPQHVMEHVYDFYPGNFDPIEILSASNGLLELSKSEILDSIENYQKG